MKRDKLGRFIKGHHYNPATEFKKGENCGINHPFWKGGKTINSYGYILIYQPNHPRAKKSKYVYEHILVAEKKLGRYLLPNEVCHHLNGIRDDNRPKNIIVCKTDKEHFKNHRKYKRYIKNNVPIPNKLGKRIIVKGKKNITKECSLCLRCGKLFWKDISKTAIKGYCSISCGILMRRYGK